MKMIKGSLVAASLLSVPLCAFAEPPADDRLSGRYGHEYSQPASAPVWAISEKADGWHALTLGDGASTAAYRLNPAGRSAFWEAMSWPTDASASADCLSWGEPEPNLSDLLGEKTAPADPRDAYGSSVLCHVPSKARQSVEWLKGNSSDWFYYDPMMGVIRIERLAASESP